MTIPSIQVLIVGQSIALSGVQAILEKQPEINLHCVPMIRLSDIQDLNPDVVLFDQGVESQQNCKEILAAHPSVKFLSLNFESKQIATFNLIQYPMQSPQDLTRLIHEVGAHDEICK
jgi:hypothetical protein